MRKTLQTDCSVLPWRSGEQLMIQDPKVQILALPVAGSHIYLDGALGDTKIMVSDVLGSVSRQLKDPN